MAITVPGSGSSATTSVTIPAHAVGDMIVIMARGTVAPTAPAAGGTVPTWTTPTNQTGVNNSVGWRLGYAIATATNHTSGTWTSAAQMHVLVLHPSAGTLAVGNDPAQGGANNTQTMIYPAFTLTAGKLANLVIRYGARGTADTEVRTDGAFAASGVWHTEQPATTPTSAVFSKVVTASEGTFTATPAGVNAAYRCGTLEITETAAPTVHSKAADVTITPAIASVATFFSVFEAAASVALTPAVASSGHKIVERSASVTLTPDVASAGEFETPSWSPDDVAGLECWLEADTIGLSDGANVTTWEDSHTSNHDATGATGQTYETGEINGLPVVRFDGVDDKLTISGLTASATTRTVFFVGRAISAGYVTADAFYGWGNNAGLRMVGGSVGASVFRWATNQASANQLIGGGPTTTATVVTMRFNSTSSADGYIDLAAATNFDPNDLYAAAGSSSVALASATTAGVSFGNIDVAAFLVYNGALADADLDDVRTYLHDKYIAAAPTVYERSASITLTPDIASAQQNFSVLERSASVTLTPAIASVPQRARLRSASVTITPAVSSAATFYSIIERSVSIALTPTIATAPQRVLMRATAVTITPAIVSAGQIEGGLVVHERSASITLTPAVASSATFYSIVERSASVTITPAIASAQMRVVMRQASVTITPAIVSSGAILQIWSRSAAVTLMPSISAAGFAGDLFETHPPLTVEFRDASLIVIHDEGDTSIIFDNSESTVIYDETTTDVSSQGDREADVPEHLTSVEVVEPVLTVDYEETPRTVEVP